MSLFRAVQYSGLGIVIYTRTQCWLRIGLLVHIFDTLQYHIYYNFPISQSTRCDSLCFYSIIWTRLHSKILKKTVNNIIN